MESKKPLVGIDYGSKLAGTTVMAWSFNRQDVFFAQSRKGSDADAFLEAEIRRLQPERVFIDAPLSLPGVYKNLPGYDNYFYRQADRELGAMSPLFLGGLTARAMQLAARMAVDKIAFMEAYPAALARELGFKIKGYKKEKASFFALLALLCKDYGLKLPAGLPVSWHYFDALLALVTALRAERQRFMVFGSRKEGLVHV